MTQAEARGSPAAGPQAPGDPVSIELLPLGATVQASRGGGLREVLFAQGVEFPCGGHGRCKGCRVRVLAGAWAPDADEVRLLSSAELAGNWRLACRGQAVAGLRIELAQWETPILADHSAFAFTPQRGLGVAVDLGTTTLAAQLLDLSTAQVLAVRTALNAQARHGADVMSRIDFAVHGGGEAVLQGLIRDQVGGLIADMLGAARVGPGALERVVLVGNTAMHHLFCGVSVAPLARHPFVPTQDGLQVFEPAALGWQWPGNAAVGFLPCLGGFVGSDILAGILATRLHESAALGVLVDLGTNGEIVVGDRRRLLCASTAAGPAFEGARISMGMRAAAGAISEVRVQNGQLQCLVLGEAAPRGLCGSGLVDAVTAGLELGWIEPSGKLVGGQPRVLAAPVTLTPGDVRQLQLAKGAIAAGIRLLLERWGAGEADVSRVYLAGAFGNYINRGSARRIGLLGFPLEKVEPAGNTALLGAKLALFTPPGEGLGFAALRQRVEHLSLNEDPRFHEVYVEAMGFPA